MSNVTSTLEISTQHLVPAEVISDADPVLHLPLPDLANDAPDLTGHMYSSADVRYPLSNDECTAPYFEQLSVRTETPEFQNAKNRVAILVGESGLAANLKYIPEETIVLLDTSPDMNIFMEMYVDSLRT